MPPHFGVSFQWHKHVDDIYGDIPHKFMQGAWITDLFDALLSLKWSFLCQVEEQQRLNIVVLHYGYTHR